MPLDFKPKLRAVEIIPFSSQGEELLLFHDRSGVAPDAAVPRVMAPLLSLFNGTRNVPQIIRAYALKGGEDLPQAFVERIVDQLDEGFLLESPRYEAQRQAICDEFAACASRPAAHAGQSYPANPKALRQMLGGFFQKAAQLDRQGTSIKTPPDDKVRGIVVPHIDFHRGGMVEALAYQQLKQPYDVFVVLGIAHCGVRYPFCAAAKDYETPLGTAPVDSEFIQALEEHVGPKLVAEQFAHKSEHSVEFVAVFLQYLEHLRNARIVPILCGGFHDEVRRKVSPMQNEQVSEFCIALHDTVRVWEKRGQRVGLIASVDLAHVGPNFDPGDNPITEAKLKTIETADREFLSCVEAGDVEAMHAHIARDNNLRNVDAHPALYTLMQAFPELRAQLLYYTYADAPNSSIVSFASMTLYED